jgi:Ca2+-binding RTX toxin-like protein
MTTITLNVNSQQIDSSFDDISLDLQNFIKVESQTLDNNISFSTSSQSLIKDLSTSDILLQSSVSSTVNGSTAVDYLDISGTGLGISTTAGLTGTISKVVLYEDVPLITNTAHLNGSYLATAALSDEIASLTLSSTSYVLNVNEAAGSTTSALNVVLSGTALPTSTAAVTSLFGLNGTAQSGSLNLSGLTVSDGLGDTLTLNANGATLNLAAVTSGSDEHDAYKVNLAFNNGGSSSITLSSAQIETLINGSVVPGNILPETVTGFTITDTTTSAVLASVSNLPSLALGTAIRDISDGGGALFATLGGTDVFTAAGTTGGLTADLGNVTGSSSSSANVGTIIAGAGSDVLTGGLGNETIIGGLGHDVLTAQPTGGLIMTSTVLWTQSTGDNIQANFGGGGDTVLVDASTTNMQEFFVGDLNPGPFTGSNVTSATAVLLAGYNSGYNYDSTTAVLEDYNLSTNSVSVVSVGTSSGQQIGVNSYQNGSFSVTSDGKYAAYLSENTDTGVNTLYLRSMTSSTAMLALSNVGGNSVAVSDASGSPVVYYFNNDTETIYTWSGSASAQLTVGGSGIGNNQFALSNNGTYLAYASGNYDYNTGVYSTVFNVVNVNTHTQVASIPVSGSDYGNDNVMGVDNNGDVLVQTSVYNSGSGYYNNGYYLLNSSGTDLLNGALSGNNNFSYVQTPSMSANGQDVVFQVSQNDGSPTTFEYNVASGTMQELSVNPNGSQLNGWMTNYAVSSDGNYVGMLASEWGSGENQEANLLLNQSSPTTALAGAAVTDVLVAGTGGDTLVGGNGHTNFVFNGTMNLGDTVENFVHGQDSIILSGGSSAWGLGTGTLTIQNGFQGAEASAYLYETSNGGDNQLYYYAGGNASTGTLVADTGTTALVSSDIVAAGSSLIASSATDYFGGLSNIGVLSGSQTSNLLFSDAISATNSTAVIGALNSNATIIGGISGDTLSLGDSSADISGMTLSGIQVLSLTNSGAATVTLGQGDLDSGMTIVGKGSADVLISNMPTANLAASSVNLSGIKVIEEAAPAGGVTTDVLVLNATELGQMANDSIIGNGYTRANGYNDVLALAPGSTAALFNLTSLASLSGIQVVKATDGATLSETFVMTASEATGLAKIAGTSSASALANTLDVTGVQSSATVDLSSVILSNIQTLSLYGSSDVLVLSNGTDLLQGSATAVLSSIVGASGNDILMASDSILDLSHTSVSGFTTLKASSSETAQGGTTFILGSTVPSSGTVMGGAGIDTLLINSSSINLTGITLASVEVIQTGSAAATTFTLATTQLTNETLVGNVSGNNTLTFAGAAADLSHLTLSNVQTVQDSTGSAVLTLSQADVTAMAGGSVDDVGGAIAMSGSLNFVTPNVHLSGITTLNASAASGNTTLSVLNAGNPSTGAGTIWGNSSGYNTLAVASSSINLSNLTLSGFQVVEALGSNAATFTLATGQLTGETLVGNGAADTLVAAAGANLLNLSATTLFGIQTVQGLVGTAADTIILSQSDLTNTGLTSVVGSSGIDTLQVSGSSLDLSTVTLTSMEVIKAGSASTATTITLNQNQLNESIVGGTAADVLTIADTTPSGVVNLTATSLSGISVLNVTGSGETVELTAAEAQALTAVNTTSGDVLQVSGSAVNLSGLTLSGVSSLVDGTASSSVTLSQSDVANVGMIGLNSGTLVAGSANLDLSTLVLSGINAIDAGSGALTLSENDASGLQSVVGAGGSLVLASSATTLNLSGLSVTNFSTFTGSSGQVLDLNVSALSAGSVVNGVGTLSLTGGSASTTDNLGQMTLSGVSTLNVNTTGYMTVPDGTSLANVTFGSTGTDVLYIGAGKWDSTTPTTVSGFVSGQDRIIVGGIWGQSVNETVASAPSVSAASPYFYVSNNDLYFVSGSSTSELAQATGLQASDITVQSNVAKATSANVTLSLNTAAVSGIDTSNTDGLYHSGVPFDVVMAESNVASTITVAAALNGVPVLSSDATIYGSTGIDTLILNDATDILSGMTLASIEELKLNPAGANLVINQSDLSASNSSVVGASGNDTIVVAGTSLNLSNTTLSGVTTMKASNGLGTTFGINQADLTAGLSTVQGYGGSGLDTVAVTGATINLSTVTLSSIEVVQDSTANSTMTLSQGQLQTLTQVAGVGSGAGADTLVALGSAVTLSSGELSGIQTIRVGTAGLAQLSLYDTDLYAGGSVIGSGGTDTLVVGDSLVNLTNTTLSGFQVIKAGYNGASTISLTQAEVSGAASVIGSIGIDTLVVAGTTQVNLSGTTLSGVEVIEAAPTSAVTTFTLNQGDLVSGGAIIGNGSDVLLDSTSSLNLSGTTLSGIKVLKAGLASGSTFTLTQSSDGGLSSIVGGTGTDTLVLTDANVNLSTVGLSSIEAISLQAHSIDTLSQSDLASGGTLAGSTLKLVAAQNTLNLTGTTLTGASDVLAAGVASSTFTLNQSDLGALSSVVGSSGINTLVLSGSTDNLTGTGLSGIQVITQTGTAGNLLTVNQGDLVNGGTILGSTGVDTLVLSGGASGAINLGSTTLSSIEILQAAAGANGMTISLLQSDLVAGGSLIGSTGGIDTLVALGTSLDLTNTTVSGIEVLQAGNRAATTFVINQSDLASSNAAIIGNVATDTVVVMGGSINLSAVSMSGIEVIRAGSATATTFTLNQSELVANKTSVIGGRGSDTLVLSSTSAATNAFDLSHVALSSVEVIKSASTAALVLTLSQSDLNSANLISNGSAATSGTVVMTDASDNLSNTTLSAIGVIKLASATAVETLSLNQGDLLSGGSIIGVSGADVLVDTGSSLNLTGTTLTGVVTLRDGDVSASTVQLKVNTADLNSGLNSIVGGASTDILILSGGNFDLYGKTLSGIEVLSMDTTSATLKLTQAEALQTASIVGASGYDTLQFDGTGSADLRQTALSNINAIRLGTANSLYLSQSDLVSGGTVTGNGASTLVGSGGSLNLAGTTLSGFTAISTDGTVSTLTLNQADLAGISTLTGNTAATTLVASGGGLNLSATVLSGFQTLQANSATSFTITQANAGGLQSVVGSSGIDTLMVTDSTVNLSALSLTSIDVISLANNATATLNQADLMTGATLKAQGVKLVASQSALDLSGTTLSGTADILAAGASSSIFTLNQSDLTALSSVVGSLGMDTLLLTGSAVNLSNTVLSGVEVINHNGSLLTINQGDIVSGGSINGVGTAADTLLLTGASIDLSHTALSNVSALQVGSTAGLTLTLNQADLASVTSVTGNVGTDVLVASGSSLNLSNTALSSIDVIKAASGSTLVLSNGDLMTNGAIVGSGSDTIVAGALSLNLSTLSGISGVTVLQAASGNSVLTVNQAELANGLSSIVGSTGTAVLAISGAAASLAGLTLSGIEVIQLNTAGAALTINNSTDLSQGGTIVGGSGIDTLIASGASLNLSGTMLSGVQVIKSTQTSGIAYSLTSADISTGGETIVGGTASDSIELLGGTLNLAASTLSGIQVLQAGAASSFTVSTAELAAGLSTFIGSAGIDSLTVTGATINLAADTLSGIEVLAAGQLSATTFTLGQADLMIGGSVIGGTGADVLVSTGSIDLHAVTLSGVQTIQTTGTGALLVASAGSETLVGSNDTYVLGETGSAWSDAITNTGSAGLVDMTYAGPILNGYRTATGNLVINVDGQNQGTDSLTVSGEYNGITSIGSISAMKVNGQTYTILAGTTASSGNDLIFGTTGADTLTVAGAGSDILIGGGGGDTFQVTSSAFTNVTVTDVGTGNTLDMGYAGVPLVNAERSNGNLILHYGASGQKTVVLAGEFSGSGGVQTYGDASQYYTIAQTGQTGSLNSGVYTVSASSGNNLLVGDDNASNVVSAYGDNTGNNLLFAGPGNDTLIAGNGNDYLDAGTGYNTLIGGAGTDVFATASGNSVTSDSIIGGTGNNIYQLGGAGTTYINATNTSNVGAASNTLVLADSFGAVSITGATASNSSISLDNQSSSDPVAFFRSGGTLSIGFDDAASSVLSITNEFDGTTGDGIGSMVGHGVSWTLVSTSTSLTDSSANVGGGLMVIGDSSVGGNILTGSTTGHDVLLGSANDTLIGFGGNNFFQSSGGDKIALSTNNSSADTILFNGASEGEDTVSNFVSGTDKIEVNSPNFGNISAVTFSQTSNASGTASVLTGFVFETDSKILYYNQNTNGNEVSTALATFSSGSVSQGDISIVNYKPAQH